MEHLKANNETYISHLRFAGGIFIGLLYRCLFFLIHGFVPSISIPKSVNVDATIEWLKEKQDHINNRID